MKSRPWEAVYALGALALFAAVVLGGAAYWYLTKPVQLTIAVAPPGSVEANLVSAFENALKDTKSSVRIRTRSYPGLVEASQALQSGQAQLAIVRPDVELPNNGLTVAILREEALIFAVPTAKKIEDIGDLAGHKLGLVDGRDADIALIRRVLERYEIADDAVEIVPLTAQTMPAAVSNGAVDAIAFVAAPVSSEAGTIVRGFAKAAGNEIAILPVSEAEALSLRYPVFSKVTLPEGAFGGRPKRPADDVTTIGISYRLMAAATVDRGPVSVLTENLFRLRSRISLATTTVNLMTAPEIDSATSAALPNHAGAVDYFNREQLTFMDRYGDWLWFALFAGGGVTSGIAWVGQFISQKKREAVDEVLEGLGALLSRARRAETHDELEKLALEVDDLVRQTIRFTRRGLTSARTMSALMLAIDSTRAAVADRRRMIDAGQRAAHTGGGFAPTGSAGGAA